MDSQGSTPYPLTNDPQLGMPQKVDSKVPDVPPPYSAPTGGAYPGGAYPPPVGMAYPPQQQPGMAAVQYQTVAPSNDAIIRSTQLQATTQVVTVGIGATCPKCRTGVLQEDFTVLGICCAIFFFPIGLICCLMMRQRRCSYCGSIYM